MSDLIDGLDVSHGDHWVVVRWKQRGDEPREVIVCKSERGYAEDLRELFAGDPDQQAIYFDAGTQCQDQDIVTGVKYYYTVFAQARDGSWHKQGREHAKVHISREDYVRQQFHPDGTTLAKLDTLRVGLFTGGGFSGGV